MLQKQFQTWLQLVSQSKESLHLPAGGLKVANTQYWPSGDMRIFYSLFLTGTASGRYFSNLCGSHKDMTLSTQQNHSQKHTEDWEACASIRVDRERTPG